MSDDVIDELAGIRPGSALDALRDGRIQARREAQASYRALFEPEDAGGFPARDRFAIATFVAALHAEPDIAAFYRARLADSGADGGLLAAIDAASAAPGQGPYGAYPPGVLSRREDQPGPTYRVAAGSRGALGPRLTAAFEHAHRLVFHPRDAAPSFLQALLDAGWSTTEIVTLSQLVAFLAFQIRAVAGLRALAAAHV